MVPLSFTLRSQGYRRGILRIVVCGANDLAGAIALNALRPIFSRHEIMFLLPNVRLPKSVDSPFLHEFHYFMSELPSQFLFSLIERRDIPTDETFLTPAELARAHNAKLHLINHAIFEQLTDDLVRFSPHLILSVRFNFIFREPLLSLPRFGIYNIHSGILPSYGGILAPFRAMLNGERVVGATLHQIDADIDTGPIVGVRELEIRPGKSVLWHFAQLYPLCTDLFEGVIASIERGESVNAQAQTKADRRYYRFPANDEISEFISGGGRFVQVEDYIELLNRFISKRDSSLEVPPCRLATIQP
jgi:methionyl-tRNA formyltransferase